jgi:hypothetical protein
MTKAELNLLKVQLGSLKEILDTHEKTLVDRLTSFFEKFTNKKFILRLSTYAWKPKEIRCEFDFMSLTNPNATDFGSNFTFYYAPKYRSDSEYILSMSCGTIGNYSLEENPLNVERAILMGNIWVNAEELKRIIENWHEETCSDYKNYSALDSLVQKEEWKIQEQEEAKQYAETKAFVESQDFKFVYTTPDQIEHTITITKITPKNYELLETRKYVGTEKYWQRYYSTTPRHCSRYNKDSFLNSYIHSMTYKNVDDNCRDASFYNTICKKLRA